MKLAKLLATLDKNLSNKIKDIIAGEEKLVRIWKKYYDKNKLGTKETVDNLMQRIETAKKTYLEHGKTEDDVLKDLRKMKDINKKIMFPNVKGIERKDLEEAMQDYELKNFEVYVEKLKGYIKDKNLKALTPPNGIVRYDQPMTVEIFKELTGIDLKGKSNKAILEILKQNFGKLSYTDWVDEICYAVEELADVTRSDAQGIVDAQDFYLQQSWTKGLSPKDTAKVILEKGESKPYMEKYHTKRFTE